MLDLAKVTSENFRPYLDQMFKIESESGKDIEAELIEVQEHPQWHGAHSKRMPFAIVFRIRKNDVLSQGTYKVAHDKMGEVHLFLVPIIPDQDGNLYEAVFN